MEGSMGYGKSHLLAVLAALLLRSGRRPVYISDCRELLGNTLSYLQSALLCAFADPSLSSIQDEIRACSSLDDLVYFCGDQSVTPLYFIIDQKNALEHEPDNTDPALNKSKAVVWDLLGRITAGHYTITGASANYNTALHMQGKQQGELKLSLMGGMTPVSRSSVSRLFISNHYLDFRRK
jgi:hypothetical protein